MLNSEQNMPYKPAGNLKVKLPRWLVKAWHLSAPVLPRIKSWLGNWPEWLSLLLTFLTLATALFSVERAHWISPQPSLVLTLLLALLVTLISAKSRLPNAAKHASILLLGAAVTVWQLSSLPAQQPWWRALATRPNENPIHFITLLIVATWVIGYVSTWFLLRRSNVWVTVSLGAAMVIGNLSNLPKEYHYFFPIYVLAAILLIGQANLSKQQGQHKKYGRSYPKHGIIYYAGVVVCLSIFVTLSTLLLPEMHLNRLSSAISNKISWRNAEKLWLNIFAAVPGKWDIIRSDKQNEMLFSDPLSQSEAIQFEVSSKQVDYWRTRRYQTYLSWGWTSNSTVDNMFYPGREAYASESLRRQELTYTVTNKLKTDVLLTTGEFKTSSLPVLLQTLRHQPEAVRLEDITKDIVSVIAPQMLQPEEPYTVTVELARPTPEELSQAGMDYDKWISRHYLQLPESLPERVRKLSQQLTERAKTPYDKAIAIKDYLQELRYSRAPIMPPPGADAVDYFLFESRAGDCTYFASATAVMLRSLGVPARISSGYRLVEKNNSSGQFILRARDYHARAEVYFPLYGWVELETTPGLSPGEDLFSPRISGFYTDEFGSSYYIDEFGQMLYFDEFGQLIYFDESGRFSGTTPSYPVYTPLWKQNPYLSVIGFLSLIIFTLGAAGVLFYQRWLNQVRRTGDAAYVYAKMCSLASMGKSGPRPSETPLEYGARLASTFPEQSQTIGNITHVYTEARFSSKKDLDVTQRVRIEKSWVQLYPALVRRILPLKRR